MNYLFLMIGLYVFLHWVIVLREGRLFKNKVNLLKKIEGLEVASSPFLSVVIAGRNEEESIRKSIESLLRQTYEHYEIIVVNDRSSDKTKEILDSIINIKSNLTVIHLEDLPSGWLGKNHALHLGAKKAKGKYLLFTDADVFFEEDALEKSMKYMVGGDFDHLVLSPNLLSTSYLFSAMQLLFALIFLSEVRPSRIGKSNNSYVGSGSFNLVKTSAYQKSGGHQKLKYEVVDDLMLGKIIIQTGGKQFVGDGTKMFSLAWYKNASGMIKGLEKNAFAALRYSHWKLLKMFLNTVIFHLIPYFMIFSDDTLVRNVFIFNLALMFLICAVSSFRLKFPLVVTFFIPIASWVLFYTYLRSTIITVKQGGIYWRQSFYKLADLKKEMV